MSTRAVDVSRSGVRAEPGARAPSRLLTLTLQTLREQRRGLLIWGLSLGLLGAFYALIYPSFETSLSEYMETMPAVWLEVLGIQAGAALDIKAFLQMEHYSLILPLGLPFFAILLAARIAGAEERQGLDVLLSNPIPRWELIVSRFLAMAAGLVVILVLVTLPVWLAGLTLPKPVDPASLAWAALGLWAFALFFGALALVAASVLRRAAFVTGFVAGVLVLMYVFNALANTVERVRSLRLVSLFYYYGAPLQEGIDWGHLGLMLGASLILVAMAVALFRRKDIYT